MTDSADDDVQDNTCTTNRSLPTRDDYPAHGDKYRQSHSSEDHEDSGFSDTSFPGSNSSSPIHIQVGTDNDMVWSLSKSLRDDNERDVCAGSDKRNDETLEKDKSQKLPSVVHVVQIGENNSVTLNLHLDDTCGAFACGTAASVKIHLRDSNGKAKEETKNTRQEMYELVLRNTDGQEETRNELRLMNIRLESVTKRCIHLALSSLQPGAMETLEHSVHDGRLSSALAKLFDDPELMKRIKAGGYVVDITISGAQSDKSAVDEPEVCITSPEALSAAIFRYTEAGDVVGLSVLLETQKCGTEQINQEDARGDTPMFIAAKHGNTRILELLYKRGGDTGIIHTQSGETLLHIASKNNHLEAVRYILNFVRSGYAHSLSVGDISCYKDIDMNAVDYRGNTACQYACENDLYRMRKLLLDHGASTCSYHGYIQALPGSNLERHLLAVRNTHIQDIFSAIEEADDIGNFFTVWHGYHDHILTNGGGDTPITAAIKYARRNVFYFLLDTSMPTIRLKRRRSIIIDSLNVEETRHGSSDSGCPLDVEFSSRSDSLRSVDSGAFVDATAPYACATVSSGHGCLNSHTFKADQLPTDEEQPCFDDVKLNYLRAVNPFNMSSVLHRVKSLEDRKCGQEFLTALASKDPDLYNTPARQCNS